MRKDKEKAIVLRTEGKSYKEIRAELGVPLATLSGWFRDQDWSHALSKKLNDKYLSRNKARIVHLGKIRGAHLAQLYEEARSEARQEFELLKNHPLFVSGVMIYWGEGDKVSKNSFRITNTDPVMIKLFLSFLLNVCQVPKERIKASLIIYPDLRAEECEKYWSQAVGLDRASFGKSTTIQGKHKSRRLQHGICVLYFPSRFLKEKMLVWMNLLPKYLLE